MKLEKWFYDTSLDGLPLLLDTIGRCPPEDVGGVPGYAEYLGSHRRPDPSEA
ncbi:IS1096 element passenger TnpR family protein [Nitrobacter sp. TKz-YC01]|uniref:IS1096 element passenger TnpR family protein n=1 Tax=Nitrobacter sp. TKz-YC01 TaxID=3398703 RepID=UPI003A10203D